MREAMHKCHKPHGSHGEAHCRNPHHHDRHPGGCCSSRAAAAGMGHGRGHSRGNCRGRGNGGGERDWRGGRRIRSDELQLIVLALLQQKPRHGYDIIKALETHSHGFYVPSPGMVYPVLTYLEEGEQVTVTLEGNKKQYGITETGRAALAQNREQAEALLDWLERTGTMVQRMRETYAEETESREGHPLQEVIHALRKTLHEKRFADPVEKQRVTAILQRALKEIDEGGVR